MTTCDGSFLREAAVRAGLRLWLAGEHGADQLIDEFWIPDGNERVDVAVVGTRFHAFEIKTHRDTLKRLPRQAESFARVFDRCTLVVDECHLAVAREVVPTWWGLVLIDARAESGLFRVVRKPKPNPSVDLSLLVKLLWKEEAQAVLRSLGGIPEPTASRASLWHEILGAAAPNQLKRLVNREIRSRDADGARIPTRRFTRALA